MQITAEVEARMFALLTEGLSATEVAKRVGVCVQTVQNRLTMGRRFDENGHDTWAHEWLPTEEEIARQAAEIKAANLRARIGKDTGSHGPCNPGIRQCRHADLGLDGERDVMW